MEKKILLKGEDTANTKEAPLKRQWTVWSDTGLDWGLAQNMPERSENGIPATKTQQTFAVHTRNRTKYFRPHYNDQRQQKRLNAFLSMRIPFHRRGLPHWRVKSSGVRQSKIYKCQFAFMAVKGLTRLPRLPTNLNSGFVVYATFLKKVPSP